MDCFCDCGCVEVGMPDFCLRCYAECVGFTFEHTDACLTQERVGSCLQCYQSQPALA